MTISDIISNIDEQNEEAIVFAKRVNGRFLPSSEVVLVDLDEEEQGSRTNEIADKHCPGFDYFLEVFLIKDMVEDLKNTVGYKSLDQQVDRIIHYAEFDA